jgi:WD40 repeat protein
VSTQASLDTVVEPGGWGDWHGQKGGGVVLECVASKEGYDALITCLITQCTNEFVYTGSVDRSVRVWDAKTGQGVKTLRIQAVRPLAWRCGRACQWGRTMSTGALNIWSLDILNGYDK